MLDIELVPRLIGSIAAGACEPANVLSSKLVLNSKNRNLFECGAALLALLASPSSTDAERAEIAASLCAAHLRATFEESGGPEELVKAKYAFRDERKVKTDLKTLDRLIRDRMVAAKVAIAFLQTAVALTPVAAALCGTAVMILSVSRT